MQAGATATEQAQVPVRYGFASVPSPVVSLPAVVTWITFVVTMGAEELPPLGPKAEDEKALRIIYGL